jgi:hypothetical protein
MGYDRDAVEVPERSSTVFPPRVRIVLASLTTALLMLGVVGVFWYQDWQYALPTPPPARWQAVATGETIALPVDLVRSLGRDGAKPILLHFFNPGCPCSKFNLDHVRSLVAEFKGRVHVVAVLQGEDAAVLQKKFSSLGLGIASVFDGGGKLAARCGVYSTPQAAIIDEGGRLYFRGNYNTNRYCTARETEFARIALTELLAGRPARRHAAEAEVAYGCPLPANASAEASPRLATNFPRS